MPTSDNQADKGMKCTEVHTKEKGILTQHEGYNGQRGKALYIPALSIKSWMVSFTLQPTSQVKRPWRLCGMKIEFINTHGNWIKKKHVMLC